MTLSFEGPDWLCMSIEVNGVQRVLCRLPCDDTDIGEQECLSDFVRRHGGIDETLRYLNFCKQVRREHRPIPTRG